MYPSLNQMLSPVTAQFLSSAFTGRIFLRSVCLCSLPLGIQRACSIPSSSFLSVSLRQLNPQAHNTSFVDLLAESYIFTCEYFICSCCHDTLSCSPLFLITNSCLLSFVGFSFTQLTHVTLMLDLDPGHYLFTF